MTTETKKAAPVQRDGQAPAKPEGKQMHNKDTALDKLMAELTDVSRHYMIQGKAGQVVVTAFVNADHVGPDVQTIPSTITTDIVCVDGMGHSLSDALDDVLGKIALAAPQQVLA